MMTQPLSVQKTTHPVLDEVRVTVGVLVACLRVRPDSPSRRLRLAVGRRPAGPGRGRARRPRGQPGDQRHARRRVRPRQGRALPDEPRQFPLPGRAPRCLRPGQRLRPRLRPTRAGRAGPVDASRPTTRALATSPPGWPPSPSATAATSGVPSGNTSVCGLSVTAAHSVHGPTTRLSCSGRASAPGGSARSQRRTSPDATAFAYRTRGSCDRRFPMPVRSHVARHLRRNPRSRRSGHVLITSSGVSHPRCAVPIP